MLPQPRIAMGMAGDTRPFAATYSHWEVTADTPPPQIAAMELQPDEMENQQRQTREGAPTTPLQDQTWEKPHCDGQRRNQEHLLSPGKVGWVVLWFPYLHWEWGWQGSRALRPTPQTWLG